MFEAKPVEGTLHHKYDPIDIFTMPVLKGYCYRYFAVADSTIKDLDLLIERKGGDLVGDDKTDHDGFAAAVARGGIALDVAHVFAGRPDKVRAWLKRVVEIEVL